MHRGTVLCAACQDCDRAHTTTRVEPEIVTITRLSVQRARSPTQRSDKRMTLAVETDRVA